MTTKSWLIFAALCIALLGGLVWTSKNNKTDVTGVDPFTVQKASEDNGNIGDRVFGNADSKVVLIEYGDYQCPGCASASGVIKQIADKYKDQIAFVFRNYPLKSIHPNALSASSAAEAAGLQGKFWEMHDSLYETQDAWKDLSANARSDYFVGLAKDLGLDGDKLLADLDSQSVQAKIAYDEALGKSQQITGTPTFYLNGKLVDQQYKDGKLVTNDPEGSQVWSDFDAIDKLIIQPALKEAGIPLPKE